MPGFGTRGLAAIQRPDSSRTADGAVSQLALIVVLCLLSALTVYWLAWRTRLGSEIRVPMVVGYLARMAAAAAVYLRLGLYAPDSIYYDSVAQQIVATWRGGADLPPIGAGKEAFPFMLAAVYWLFGHIPFAVIVLNATVSAVVVMVVSATAARISGRQRTVAWLAATYPPLVLWGSLLMREAVTYLLLALSLWAVVGLWKKTSDRRAWAVLLISLVLLLGFRGSAATIVGAASIIALVLRSKRIWVIGAGIVAAGALVAGGAWFFGPDHLADSRMQLSGEATTGFLPSQPPADPIGPGPSIDPVGADPSIDPVGMGRSILQVLPRVALGPYPWEWSRVGIPLALDAVCWLVVLVAVGHGWARVRPRAVASVLLIPAAALFMALVITSGNYGTMQRLRVQVAVAVLPLASMTWLPRSRALTSGTPPAEGPLPTREE